ncbi:helix-turn-helix domain-containing protein [Aliiglaciecola sp. CAU 1673]|uniref:AraC family transcriptional regulator n=1 Tax=Aliiglaciecola sp. CAU 1673 TaxID=3032595 RepID=UPI0023DADFD2|nr:helix-turn-helix domain-containing protein [Aliiglaciecola sp. CAU 1673]MDF2178096.1 helix-turn-helix domain-containing protein [Aliiglaciecola sp. CAU 1673]
MAQHPLHLRYPQRRLRPYIRCFWLGRESHQDSFDIIPDGCIDLVLCTTSQEQTFCFGTSSRFLTVPISPNVRYLGIRFAPGQARHFINTPAHLLTDNHMELFGALKQRLSPVFAQPDAAQALALLEEICLNWLQRNPPQAMRLDQIIKGLSQYSALPLAVFCEQMGIGQRQLQRLCKEWIGLSPKQYQRIARANQALHFLQKGEDTPLAQIALASGYADQSHMQREVKWCFGQTPLSLMHSE